MQQRLLPQNSCLRGMRCSQRSSRRLPLSPKRPEQPYALHSCQTKGVMPHRCPCRVLVLSTSQDHVDVLEGWQQRQSLFLKATGLRNNSLHLSGSVHRTRPPHLLELLTTFVRGTFPCYACCHPTIQQDNSPCGPGRSLTGLTARVPGTLRSSGVSTNAQS